jgi:hypothetical protein
LNEGVDAHDIAGRLQAQFGEYVDKYLAVQFWIAEVWLGCQDLHDDFAPEDLLWIILMPKFWRY